MKRISIYFISLLLILFLFELLNGFWFRSPLEKNLLNFNALYNVDIEINPNDYYPSGSDISYSRNTYGLRVKCHNPKNINLVTIGGSTTDQRYIDFENTFSYILQEEITRNTGVDFCVANAGVDGHNLLNHINSLESWFPLIPSFNPNYYLLNIGINDAAILNVIPENNVNNANNFLSFVKFKIIRNSYLYSFYKKVKNLIGISLDRYGVLTHKKNIKNDFKYTALNNTPNLERDIIKNSETFGRNFKKIINIIKNKGGIPICILQDALFVKGNKGIHNAFPYQNDYLNGFDLQLSLELINNQIKETCFNANGIIVSIDNNHFTENDFYDFVHHNPQGSRKLAKLIFNSIKDQL